MQVLTGHQGFPPSRKSVRLGIGSTFVGNLGMLKHVAVLIPVSLPGRPGFKCTVIHHESRCLMCKYNMIIQHSVYTYIYIYICVCVRSTIYVCVFHHIHKYICRFMSMCPFTCACVCQQRYQRCGPQPSRTVLYKDLRQLLRFSDCSITPRKLSKADWHVNKSRTKSPRIKHHDVRWLGLNLLLPESSPSTTSRSYTKEVSKGMEFTTQLFAAGSAELPALWSVFNIFQLAIWIYLAEPQAKRTTARSAVFSGLRPNSTARLWM